MPLPFNQVVPLLVLYSQVALGSSPPTLTIPELVILSVEELPESIARDSVGAAAVVSKVTVKGAEKALILLALSVAWAVRL